MKPLTIHQIRQAVAGKALSALPKDAPPVKSVFSDSRRVEPFSLFVAIRGANHDGHDHIPDAAARGAVAALVCEMPRHSLPNIHLIGVDDTRKAMGKLATFVRRQMKSTVIAVAGSNGKTTTKFFIDSVLSPHKRGSISPKSFNNDIGVPLAIFPANPMDDYLVLEIGTNHHGEVRHLAEMAEPDIGVITNVGAEHLEGLDDLDGVRREEASLLQGLKPGGHLIVNGDDEGLVSLVSSYSGKIVKFGLRTDAENHLFATDIECGDDGVRFSLNGDARRRVFVPMLGKHSASNALAAIAVGKVMRLTEEAIIAALASASAPEMRLQLSKVNGVRLLNDAYNANPNSTRAAIETLLSLPARGRRVAVLGDMLELGKQSDAYHKEAGVLAAGSKLDLLICVGKKAQLIAASAKAAGLEAPRIVTYPDAAAAARGVMRRVRGSDLVLLKASRGIGLEAVAQAIAESGGRRPARKAV